MGIVPSLDIPEDFHPGFLMRAEASAVNELTFERGEERFAHRIVITVSDRPHRRANPHFFAATAEGQGSILSTLIRVMDHPLRSTLKECHIQGIQH